MASLRIGCLAWGSLLWDPRTLPVSGPFRDDGPMLPIEFSRVSTDGRVTLVLDESAQAIRSYWVRLDVENVAEAVHALGIREKIAPSERSRWVGVQTSEADEHETGETNPQIRESIVAWLRQEPLDAVVWTALPSRGPAGEAARPDLARLLAHLESLEGEARRRAEEYIRRAPVSVRTHHRARFEKILGWLPSQEEAFEGMGRDRADASGADWHGNAE